MKKQKNFFDGKVNYVNSDTSDKEECKYNKDDNQSFNEEAKSNKSLYNTTDKDNNEREDIKNEENNVTNKEEEETVTETLSITHTPLLRKYLYKKQASKLILKQ